VPQGGWQALAFVEQNGTLVPIAAAFLGLLFSLVGEGVLFRLAPAPAYPAMEWPGRREGTLCCNVERPTIDLLASQQHDHRRHHDHDRQKYGPHGRRRTLVTQHSDSGHVDRQAPGIYLTTLSTTDSAGQAATVELDEDSLLSVPH
jgi:hypothetical protein